MHKVFFFFFSQLTHDLSLTWSDKHLVTPPRPLPFAEEFPAIWFRVFYQHRAVLFWLMGDLNGRMCDVEPFQRRKTVLPLRRVHSHARDSCCFAIILKIWRTVPGFELSSRFMLCYSDFVTKMSGNVGSVILRIILVIYRACAIQISHYINTSSSKFSMCCVVIALGFIIEHF